MTNYPIEVNERQAGRMIGMLEDHLAGRPVKDPARVRAMIEVLEGKAYPVKD